MVNYWILLAMYLIVSMLNKQLSECEPESIGKIIYHLICIHFVMQCNLVTLMIEKHMVDSWYLKHCTHPQLLNEFYEPILLFLTNIHFLIPPHIEIVGGYIGFTPSVRPSICPSVSPTFRVCSVAPTVLVGSISYLYILLSHFRRCDTCKAFCKI